MMQWIQYQVDYVIPIGGFYRRIKVSPLYLTYQIGENRHARPGQSIAVAQSSSLPTFLRTYLHTYSNLVTELSASRPPTHRTVNFAILVFPVRGGRRSSKTAVCLTKRKIKVAGLPLVCLALKVSV
ncbi:hypothetical protein TcWFU_003884 [Taenia crassiceps]|uniref:Uncharacterized protein n=1 Tax=Taenia crassiceps TaxID=6207 RepID=A0ABR4QGM6_9CEST